ncbi:MAG: hypothetical protein VW683_00225 [Betaproteobacteria bacterium]|jgi:hypothetical protein
MPKVVDPDNLVRDTSIRWDITSPTARTIGISSSTDQGGSLIPPLESGSDSGVTFQCLYSFAKEQWKEETDLIKIPFPFISITKNQFDMQNEWNFESDATRYLVRDGGWSVLSGSSNVTTEEWIGVVTLGTLGTTDQVYVQQSGSAAGGTNGAAVNNVRQNFVMSGSVNQAIQHYSASVDVVERNFRNFTKIFVREYQKTYSDASIQETLSVAEQEYTVYSLPLTNATDTKITTTAESQATGAPYNEVTITFFTGSGFFDWANATTYVAEDVVRSATTGRYYITLAGGTSSGTDADLTGSSDAGVTWFPYEAERLVNDTYYAFNTIVDLGSGKNNSIEQGYTRVQYELRLDSDIDDGTQFTTDFVGELTDVLAVFVGDNLITSNGVFIDNFQDADTNSIEFYDVSGSSRTFDFVSAGTIEFNSNLELDPSGSFFMFFTSVPSGDYGTTNAIIVNDNDDLPITGSTSASSQYSFTFDYDNNNQGGRTSGSDASVTVVAIGLETAAYVVQTGTIARSKTNVISLVSALERNYDNPV